MFLVEVFQAHSQFSLTVFTVCYDSDSDSLKSFTGTVSELLRS